MELGSLTDVLEADVVKDIIGYVMMGSLQSSVDFNWVPQV